jgi:hypothetical protein
MRPELHRICEIGVSTAHRMASFSYLWPQCGQDDASLLYWDGVPPSSSGGILEIDMSNINQSAYLRMLGTHRHSLSNLFVHDNMNLDTLLGLSLQNSVKPPRWIVSRRSAEV